MSTGQIKLPIEFTREADRNRKNGGRSFYFFDFDDNVIHLPTEVIIFKKSDSSEKKLSTEEFAQIKDNFNDESHWAFEYAYDLLQSFKNFREVPESELNGKEQPLIEDLKKALQNPQGAWRGPCWDFFEYAVANNRPISIITARGHHPFTIKRAINYLVENGDLKMNPNMLSVFPINHPETKKTLQNKLGSKTESVSELKKAAIFEAVQEAFACYGKNKFHRFGMSDDDLENVGLISQAMKELKESNPENAFYVINTHGRKILKKEITLNNEESTSKESQKQKQYTLSF